MIAPTHTEKPFKANRVFTDREDARDLFRSAAMNDQSSDEYRVLMWYGVGGQGKSALYRECQRMLKSIGDAAANLPNKRAYIWARVDFEESLYRRPEEALRSIRLQRARAGGVSFPAFDAAFALYMLKTNPGIDIRQRYPELFRGESEVVDDLIELSEGVLGIAAEAVGAVIPGANIIYKWGSRLTGRLQEWWKQRGKSVLEGIDTLLPDEILERMPTYLGADLCHAQQANPRLRPVVLLDTYEALWRDRARKDGVSDRRADQWIRLLVQDSPGALFAIFGRDKLRWAEIDPDWGGIVDAHLLGKLSDEDADDFLRKIPIKDAKVRARIIDGAEGLPFYLDLQVDLYERLATGDETPKPQHFGGSHGDILDRFLDHLNDSEQGALRLASYLDTITQEEMSGLVDTFPGRVANFRWPQLISRSFFTEGLDGEFVLHALMREELQRRERAEEPGHFERVHRHLFEKWQARIAPPENTQPAAQNEQAFERARMHLGAVDPERSVGWVLKQAKPFERAARLWFLERIYGASLVVSLETLGEEHPNTLTTRHNIAQQMGNQGRYGDAEAEFRAVWEIRRRPDVLGEEHPDTLTARHNIAHQMGNQGRYGDAEVEFRAVWEIRRRPDVLGEEHPDTLTTRSNIAQQMGRQGRYGDAEAEFRAVWEILRRTDVLGEEHPNTLTTRANIAHQMGNQGRYGDAEAEFRAVWEIWRRPDVLGEEHPNTLTTRHNIAQQMGRQGRYGDAEAEFRAVWEILRRPDVLGEEHPDTLTARHNIAHQMGNQGRYGDAEAEFRAVWEIRRRPDVLGEEHPDTLATRHNIAQQMGRQGRYGDAEAEFRAVWEIERRPDVLGEEHPNTLATRANIAQQMAHQGRYGDAEAEFRAVWEILRRTDVLGEEHPNTLRTRFLLAKTLDQLGRADEASALLTDLREAFLKRLTESHEWIQELEAYLAAR